MSVNTYNSQTGKLELIAGGLLYADAPVGAIVPYGGTTAPNGWLLCQGQAVSRTTYAELFAIIGTNFGTGDGSTTFNIPDLRGEFLRGAGTNSHSGQGNGGTVGQHQDATEIPSLELLSLDRSDTSAILNRTSENGDVVINADTSKNRIGYQQVTTSAFIEHAVQNTGDFTTRPTNTSVNYIIKAKHTSVPTDFADSMIGYLGKETNYNLYPWSHERTVETADDNQDITVERDGWYSIDYTLSSGVDITHTFTLRDFDNQGDVHTIMRAHYDKSGTFRQTFLVPLKAGTYRYSHGGIGTLSVYMNRRDFA